MSNGIPAHTRYTKLLVIYSFLSYLKLKAAEVIGDKFPVTPILPEFLKISYGPFGLFFPRLPIDYKPLTLCIKAHLIQNT